MLGRQALETPPETSSGRTAPGEGDERDPTQLKTVEDIALYAHGTGRVPPGSRAGSDAQTVYTD